MSTAPIDRHPLGLPAGSVRALLALAITITFWVHLVVPTTSVPMYLYFMLVLVPVFFASSGQSTDAGPRFNPLYLPGWLIRLLIVAGSVAVLVWQFITSPDLLARLRPDPAEIKDWPYYFLALVGGCTVGWLIGRGPWRKSSAFQDVQAWISMLAMLAFAAEIVIDLVIKPQTQLLADRHIWHAILIGVMGFYFASRS